MNRYASRIKESLHQAVIALLRPIHMFALNLSPAPVKVPVVAETVRRVRRG